MSACPFRIGDIVKTSYDTGPYEIVKISGPCRCAPFGWVINHMGEVDPEDWEEHWHLECSKNIKISLDKRIVACYL